MCCTDHIGLFVAMVPSQRKINFTTKAKQNIHYISTFLLSEFELANTIAMSKKQDWYTCHCPETSIRDGMVTKPLSSVHCDNASQS